MNRKCEKCEQPCVIWNVTKYGKEDGGSWKICDKCYKLLFEFESNKVRASYIREEVEKEYEMKLSQFKKSQGRYYKLFGNLYIRI